LRKIFGFIKKGMATTLMVSVTAGFLSGCCIGMCVPESVLEQGIIYES